MQAWTRSVSHGTLTLGELTHKAALLARIGVLPHLRGVERHVSMEACELIEGRDR